MSTGKIRISDLKEKASQRPAGYLDEFLAAGTVVNDLLEIPLDRYRELWRKYAPDSTMPNGGCSSCGQSKSIPKKGLGSLVERMAKPIAKALGLNCLDDKGELKPESPCAKRRDALNKAVPFT